MNPELPIIEHLVECPYCGETELIETHSTETPKHCSKPKCAKEHTPYVSWKRAINTELPIIEHLVKCPYCGETELIETHSTQAPEHCSKLKCYKKHNDAVRRLKKKRKRALRTRHKTGTRK